VQARDEAEALAIALDFGVVKIADVVTWADAWLAAEVSAHWIWSELSLAAGADEAHVIDLLRQIPGDVDRSHAQRLLLALLLERLADKPVVIAKALYHLAMHDVLESREVVALAWWSWDAIDLAAAKITAETVDDVVARMRQVIGESLKDLPARDTEWRFRPG
jgi:hypothetical protein